MGANQSSKASTASNRQHDHQLPRRFSFGSHQRSVSSASSRHKKLAQSLRMKFKSRSKNIDFTTQLDANNNLGGSLRQQNNNQVSAQKRDEPMANNGRANYVTKQQLAKSPKQRPALFANPLLAMDPARQRPRNENNNYGFVSAAAGAATTTSANNYFPNRANELAPMMSRRQVGNVVDDFNGSFSNGHGAFQSDQAQAQHPLRSSKAVNAKTSALVGGDSVLADGNVVAMPSGFTGRNSSAPGNQFYYQQRPYQHYQLCSPPHQAAYANQSLQAHPQSAQFYPLESDRYSQHAADHELAGQLYAVYPSSPLDFHQASLQQNDRFQLSKSQTLEVRKKNPLSPLASLFTNNSNSKHSNTIHLGRRHQRQADRLSFSNSLKRIKSSPLSAQQASYEAMRTIDMYMIRQIARSCMDFEMEQKIDLEIRLRELAAQSLLEASNEIDVLEVEKSLLTSDQRMNCYAALLEQQRKQLSNPSLSIDSGRGSKNGHTNTISRRSSANRTKQTTDVIGGPPNTGANRTTENGSSPSFSSLSNSQSSPSKLSPISGESANSTSFTTQSSHHSRTGALRHSQNTTSWLTSRQKAKNKKREQLLQHITSLSNINCNMVFNNKASLSISELRIPLMWRDVDHFKQRGDYKRYAIFCLLKINSQIYDTQLISDVDRHKTDVTFDDLIIFNEIDYNFELQLEVYSCVYLEEFSLSSTPRKLKEKLTSSVSKAMGRKLLSTQTASANYTKELQAYDRSYRFSMIASTILKLEDSSNSVKTYDLVLVSPSAHHRHHQQSHENHPSPNKSDSAEKNTLPLFGHFCCKLSVAPDVFDKNVKTGFLKMATIELPQDPEEDKLHSPNRTSLSSKMSTMSIRNATIHYSLLRNFHLHLWPVDEKKLEYAVSRNQMLPSFENLHKTTAPLILSINRFTRLLRVSNSSVTLETDRACYIISAYCSVSGQLSQADEMGYWLRAIEQLIYDSHIWSPVLNHRPPSFASGSDTIDKRNTHNYQRESPYMDNSFAGTLLTSRRGSPNISRQRQSRELHYYGNAASLRADL